jgi:hypothetical protein
LIREKKGSHGRSRRNLTFHSLRHGAASNVFNAAVVKEVARRVTAHAEHGSLDRYLHVDLQAIRSATALIPRGCRCERRGASELPAARVACSSRRARARI